jgi:streptogramin lyase
MRHGFLACLVSLAAALASAQSYELYVSDAGNFDKPPWQILKFDGDGTNPSVFIKDNLNWPQDILFLPDGSTVLVSSLGSGRITRHDAATGAYLGDFAASIGGPTRMRIGPDGQLYVLQWGGNGRVKRYGLDGRFLGDFTTVGVPQSIGLAWDGDGSLYVSSYSQDHVRKFDPAGKDLGLFIDSNLTGPTNIWFDEAGDLLVADYDGRAVRRFDRAGNYLGDFIRGVTQVEGVDFLPNGDILLGDGGARAVKRFDRNGAYLRNHVAAGAGGLLTPNAVVLRALPDPIPTPPDQLTATTFGHAAVLNWRDRSDTESGFRILRGVDGKGREAIASVGENVTSFADGTIESGHVYDYAVASFTSGGESEPSNGASASTTCRTQESERRLRPLRPSTDPCTTSAPTVRAAGTSREQ